jgi:hypothetical protein
MATTRHVAGLAADRLLGLGPGFGLWNKVFFLWDHTNFADADAVACSLHQLEQKAKFLQETRPVGKLNLVQKSSVLVPGKPEWEATQVYKTLIARTGRRA